MKPAIVDKTGEEKSMSKKKNWLRKHCCWGVVLRGRRENNRRLDTGLELVSVRLLELGSITAHSLYVAEPVWYGAFFCFQFYTVYSLTIPLGEADKPRHLLHCYGLVPTGRYSVSFFLKRLTFYYTASFALVFWSYIPSRFFGSSISPGCVGMAHLVGVRSWLDRAKRTKMKKKVEEF